MSFLKIKDPSKRDKLVAEYLKTKNKIQNDFRSERFGEQSVYEEFGKICKPITEQQQKSSEEIVSTFALLQKAIENITPALPWGHVEKQPEALPAPDDGPMNVGEIAGNYLAKLTSKKTDVADRTSGLGGERGNLRLGDAEFKTDGNDMTINGKRYKGTEGLWELVTMKKPRTGVYDGEDLKIIKKL